MDIVSTGLGPEGSLKLKFEGGFLVVEVIHKHASGEVNIVAKENADYFFDKLAMAIPGTLDDVVIALVKDAVKKL